MSKNIMTFLFILLFACDSQNEDALFHTGTVANKTSCAGGFEPVFVIKLNEKDSIITSTLTKEFQILDLKIQFRTKENSSDLFCTQDKIYPKHFDVYDVISF